MWTNATVLERIDWNDKLFTLKLQAEISPFIAGQFIKLSQQHDDKRVARAYSLVNSPGADHIEVLAVKVEDGLLSPALHELNAGDTIEVSTKAAGFMTLDELPKDKGRHLWLLATGTAVGPFISMLETTEPWQRFDKIVLVYGVRKQGDLAYWQQLQAMAEKHPDKLALVACVTREPVDYALSCRIPDGLKDGSIEAKAGVTISPEDSQVMICGNPGMVADALALLQERGLAKNLRRAPGQITMEKYW